MYEQTHCIMYEETLFGEYDYELPRRNEPNAWHTIWMMGKPQVHENIEEYLYKCNPLEYCAHFLSPSAVHPWEHNSGISSQWKYYPYIIIPT